MPWNLSNWSHPRLVTSAVMVGLVVLLSSLGADRWFHGSERNILLSDGLTAVVATCLTYKLLRSRAIRQKVATQYLLVVTDVNHHVRNALAGILYSVHLRGDPHTRQIVEDAIQRIDSVLRDMPIQLEFGSLHQQRFIYMLRNSSRETIGKDKVRPPA